MIKSKRPGLDPIDRGLEEQNRNPVKVLMSGLEARVAVPFEASGKIRQEERVPWWESYSLPEICAFGHYAIPFGNPFDPAGKPQRLRVNHLRNLKTPALIVQGERDPFGSSSDVAAYELPEAVQIHWLSMRTTLVDQIDCIE